MSGKCVCSLCRIPVDCGEHICPVCEIEVCQTEEELISEQLKEHTLKSLELYADKLDKTILRG